MKPSRETVVRRYLACLAASDVDGLIGLFAADGFVVSPFLGKMPAADFFPKVVAASARSVITPYDVLLSGANRAAAWFRYDWTLADGTAVAFECVDVFEFDGTTDLFASMTIVYDTHPIRARVGDKYG